MKYLYFKNEPGAPFHSIEASNKSEALKKISALFNTSYCFGNAHSFYEYELVSYMDYCHHNWSKYSYLVRKEQT